MAGVSRQKITETAEELKQILTRQKIATEKERVQLLYLLQEIFFGSCFTGIEIGFIFFNLSSQQFEVLY